MTIRTFDGAVIEILGGAAYAVREVPARDLKASDLIVCGARARPLVAICFSVSRHEVEVWMAPEFAGFRFVGPDVVIYRDEAGVLVASPLSAEQVCEELLRTLRELAA